MLASDFTGTDHTLRIALFKYFLSLDNKQLSDIGIDTKNKDMLCAMMGNYLLGDAILRDDASTELVAVYKKYGNDIPKHADRIIRQNPELLWIIVQFLRGRVNVMSALDFPDDPSKFWETEVGQRIGNLLGIYGGEVKEAIDYDLLKQRLGVFEKNTLR